METGRCGLRPVFIFVLDQNLVAVPAAEAIIEAADSFAPFETVVSARAVEVVAHFCSVYPVRIVANNFPLVRLSVGRAREEKSTTQYGRR